MAASGVPWVQGNRTNGSLGLHQRKTIGSTVSVATGRRQRDRRSRPGPAGRSARRLRRAPSAIGQHAGDHGTARHQDGPQPARPPRPRHPTHSPRRAGRRSANVTSKMALATATPIAMIAPMNDWMFSVVPVSHRASDDAGQHRRDRERRCDQRQAERLEVRRKSRKMTTIATDQPKPEAAEHLLHRHDLAAHVDVDAARRVADSCDRQRDALATRPRSSPAMFAVMVNIRCML